MLSLRGLQCSVCFLEATTKASKSPAKGGDGGGSSADFKMVSSGLTENQLQLSVEVSPTSSCLPRLEKGRRVDKVLPFKLGLTPFLFLSPGVNIPLLF